MGTGLSDAKPNTLEGFPAGTFVHTKEGLKKIEQVVVGDFLLSRHQSEEGKREFKRVSMTFSHADQPINLIFFRGKHSNGIDWYSHFAATRGCLVWVRDKGWKPAEKLKMTFPKHTVLEQVDKEHARVGGNVRLFATHDPEVAWVPSSSVGEALSSLGGLINVRTLEIAQKGEFLQFDDVRRTKRVKPEHLYRAPIFNLEVEDFHTFYVGGNGVLVSNPSANL